LNKYDVILLNCGGTQVDPTSTGGQAFIPNRLQSNLLKSYVNAGGRVFAEHFHWAWIRSFTEAFSPHSATLQLGMQVPA